MKSAKVLLLTVLPCMASAAFAGGAQPATVPTLGEVGLVLLGVSLIGGGVVALRRGKR